MLGDMVIFHIAISPACEIADTQYYRAGVGAREKLSVLVIGYFIIIWWFKLRVHEREPGSTNNQNNIFEFHCLTTETVKYINESSFIENLPASKYSMLAQRGKQMQY